MKIIAYFDGALGLGSQAGCGCWVQVDRETVWKHSSLYHGIKPASCNVAEYAALIQILVFFKSKFLRDEPTIIRGDSMLVIKQMTKRWRIKNGLYVPLAKEALYLLS